MKNQMRLMWAGVIVLTMLASFLLMQPVQVSAQATATFTPTSAATNTPTATATPIATALPLVINASGQYIGQRVGIYGMPTPNTAGSAFQSAVGSIDLYNLTTGRQTFHVANDTGNVTAYGSITANGGTPVAVTSGVVQSETANVYLKCVDTASVIGTVTATPVSGATPIGQPWVSLAGTITGDAARAYGSYSAGTFTIGVMNTALTPAPNTTPIAVKWCYTYSK